jgi:ubiquinone/menaquinone biosynthesis C-methylase UbiE
MRNWRQQLVRDLTGEVLEIGVGSGANLEHYLRATHVWAIEPDAEQAKKAAAAGAHAAVPVEVRVAPAEALPFSDHSFDHVVSSLVFCSVTNPVKALAEIGRVLRPGGVLNMVEHVRPAFPPLALVASLATPAWSRIAHYCHLDRTTVDLLQNQGWSVEIHQRWFHIFLHLSARKA